MKLRDLGEHDLIARVTGDGELDPTRVVRGIGDDCSVTRIDDDRYQLVTTDMLVEDVHFVRNALTAEQLGAKSVAVSLSDIAAMGGTPLDAWMSLAMPTTLEVPWVDGLFAGVERMLSRFGVNLLGGDTTRGDRVVINIVVAGEVREEEILMRDGARVGDHIFVSGPLGDSAAGLDAATRGRAAPELIRRHFEPEPHVNLGRLVATSGHARAAIDVSDGLACDLHHICDASGVGCSLDSARLPLSTELCAYCVAHELDPLDFALGGGEDYVLLVTGDLALSAVPGLVEIGEITSRARELIRDGTRVTLEPKGWDHLRG